MTKEKRRSPEKNERLKLTLKLDLSEIKKFT